MGTVVVNVPPSVAPSGLIPGELATQVEWLRMGGTRFPGSGPDDPGLVLPAPPAEYHPAAPAALAAIEPLCEPAREAVARLWLNTLATSVNQPPPATEMADRVAAIMFKCGDMPAGAWSQESLLEAMGAFDWWPSVAQLHALLKPYADRITGTRDALRRIVDAANRKPPPAPQKREVDDDAVRHVRAVVGAFEAGRTFDTPATLDSEARPVTPSHLSDGALLASYEKLAAENAPGAQVRLSMLRRKLNECSG